MHALIPRFFCFVVSCIISTNVVFGFLAPFCLRITDAAKHSFVVCVIVLCDVQPCPDPSRWVLVFFVPKEAWLAYVGWARSWQPVDLWPAARSFLHHLSSFLVCIDTNVTGQAASAAGSCAPPLHLLFPACFLLGFRVHPHGA